MKESNKENKQKKIKRSKIDKILFILLSIAAVVVFVWDIIKDFIPNEYWQLKLLVMIVGALSGFFGVLSFFWDKKFSNIANDITSDLNSELDKISDNINIYIKEENNYYDSFNDAIMPIINSNNKKSFDEVKIFAYSAKNYVDYIMRSSLTINKLYLCLKRANDYSAWFVHNESRVNKYKNELEKVLEGLENLKEKNQVHSYEVRFYDFESYSHFGIFDDQILLGELIPNFTENKTVQIGKIQTMTKVGRNISLFKNKEQFFDNLFNGSVTDSGLKLSMKGCHYCNTTQTLLDPHYISGSKTSFGKCDMSLIDDTSKIKDFMLEPDFHPISDLHMLLVCKFHILNLYDYLNHKHAIEELETLISKIRNTVYKKTGREILVFEHGTSSQNSALSGSSIEHLHTHIIYEPKEYNYVNAIIEDNKSKDKPLLDINKSAIKLTNLHEFAHESSLRNKDYFMIWKPGQNISQSEMYIWLPINKESQYLRRIFFQGLDETEKLNLYEKALDGGLEGKLTDAYDWKKYKFNYSDERIMRHKEIGAAIFNERK